MKEQYLSVPMHNTERNRKVLEWLAGDFDWPEDGYEHEWRKAIV